MKYYILINPFNYKVIQFSTFKDEDFNVANIPDEVNNNTVIITAKALCIESEYDPDLLGKTYDPQTKTFN